MKPTNEAPMNSRWYTTEFRVRYQETDQMGVVYHANYLNWFEIGRTEMIRQLGLTYRSIEEAGAMLPVIDAELSYKMPAHYDDSITVFTCVTEFSKLRLSYAYEVRRLSAEEANALQGTIYTTEEELPGEQLVLGATKHVWVSKEDWKPTRLDKCAPQLYDVLKQKLTGGA